MNSLTYISNQFDAYASPRAPPSTPTSEYPSTSESPRKSNADPSELKRVKTWSNRSFLFPHASHYPTLPPKRSFSSPANFFAIASMRQPATSTSLDADISPSVYTQSLIRRIFFIRVFVQLWRLLYESWTSLTNRDDTKAKQAVMVVSNSDGKDNEDEKPTISQNLELSLHPPNPTYLPPPTELPDISTFPSETNSDPQLPSRTDLSVGPQPGTSRSSTPVLNARKTPFHLPKTLVLDLDETLIHSTSRPISSSGSGSGLLGLNTFGRMNKSAGHMVDVVLGGRSTLYHVYKRPFVDFFLRTVRRRVLDYHELASICFTSRFQVGTHL
jgi:CTD nuclear envelope phosphatase 1